LKSSRYIRISRRHPWIISRYSQRYVGNEEEKNLDWTGKLIIGCKIFDRRSVGQDAFCLKPTESTAQLYLPIVNLVSLAIPSLEAFRPKHGILPSHLMESQ
jgi:hypothetical protein